MYIYIFISNYQIVTHYLQHTGNSKPTSIAVDWLAENLYWTETDRSNTKPRGRVMVAKLDGRYRRSLIDTGLYYVHLNIQTLMKGAIGAYKVIANSIQDMGGVQLKVSRWSYKLYL